MAFSIYDASLPVYARHLRALSAIIDKAEAYTTEKKLKPETLLIARLYPDMFTFAEQIRAVCNHATRGGARLSGVPTPARESHDTTFAEVKARIDWALDFVGTITPAQLAGAEAREVVFPSGSGERRMTGHTYLTEFSMPNFMFHATTAYDILRHNGVPLHKADFLGT